MIAAYLFMVAYAATEVAGSTVDPAIGLAALITAGVGVVAFLLSVWRGRANNEAVGEVQDAAKYLNGFEALTDRLREEIDEVREEQREDKRQWNIERTALEKRVNELENQLNRSLADNIKLRDELIEFRGQVKQFLGENYHEFENHLSRDPRS